MLVLWHPCQSHSPSPSDQRWIQDITRAWTERALQEFHILWERLQGISTQPFADSFIWRWTANGQYSARSAYSVHLGAASITGAKLIWMSWAPSKVRFFLWLAILGRLWTAERRFRHGLQADATCKLCDQGCV